MCAQMLRHEAVMTFMLTLRSQFISVLLRMILKNRLGVMCQPYFSSAELPHLHVGVSAQVKVKPNKIGLRVQTRHPR